MSQIWGPAWTDTCLCNTAKKDSVRISLNINQIYFYLFGETSCKVIFTEIGKAKRGHKTVIVAQEDMRRVQQRGWKSSFIVMSERSLAELFLAAVKRESLDLHWMELSVVCSSSPWRFVRVMYCSEMRTDHKPPDQQLLSAVLDSEWQECNDLTEKSTSQIWHQF